MCGLESFDSAEEFKWSLHVESKWWYGRFAGRVVENAGTEDLLIICPAIGLLILVGSDILQPLSRFATTISEVSSESRVCQRRFVFLASAKEICGPRLSRHILLLQSVGRRFKKIVIPPTMPYSQSGVESLYGSGLQHWSHCRATGSPTLFQILVWRVWTVSILGAIDIVWDFLYLTKICTVPEVWCLAPLGAFTWTLSCILPDVGNPARTSVKRGTAESNIRLPHDQWRLNASTGTCNWRAIAQESSCTVQVQESACTLPDWPWDAVKRTQMWHSEDGQTSRTVCYIWD